jgi:glycosyltransferase involved in cell wall biosynthesis
MVVHMLGGAEMRKLLARGHGLRFYMNRYVLRRFGAIVVEGATQAKAFASVAETKRIHIIHNFAEPWIAASEVEAKAKFSETGKLRVLFLSNLLHGKGHEELLAAYRALKPEVRRQIHIDVAGIAVPGSEDFLARVDSTEGVTYHGFVQGAEKRDLFVRAHLFCLPTYYPYEGQPFSIIEAFAAACVVVTTNHSGIRDVFDPGANGFEVEKASVPSLTACLERVVGQRGLLAEIGLRNHRVAELRHSQVGYVRAMRAVMQDVAKAARTNNSVSDFDARR